MNETLKQWLQFADGYWKGLSTANKAIFGGVAALVVGVALIFSALAQRDPMKLLYTDLQPDESRAVVKKLGEQKIPYVLSDDGHTVSVPTSKVDSARLELAKDGIPGQDVVGFEKFDGSTLGMSTYVQRIQYVRAVQGELTRSIERLKSVKRARVHISLPPKKTFLEEEDPPKASVILELAGNQKPNKQEITGIAHLVASAVEGLNVSQISIVDTRGDFLHRPGDDGTSDKPSALLEQQRTIEREYERRVEDILAPVIGMGKVRARVTAELDITKSNMTEETFDPDRTVARSNVKNEESTNGSRPNPIGIPGSRSNLPGAEAQNPATPMATTNSEKVTQNTNYAVPRKVTVTSKPSGSIKRLTVAVVVDGLYSKPANGKGTELFQPRSPEELQRLRDLVANSIGFDDGRRDSLTITSMPFAPTDLTAIEEVAPVDSPLNPRTNPWMRFGLFGLLGLVVLWLVVRPMIRWVFGKPEEAALGIYPRTLAELEAGTAGGVGPNGQVLALTQASAAIEDSEPLEKKEEEDLRKRILERLTAHPKKGFRIVQDWLEEHVPAEPTKQAIG